MGWNIGASQTNGWDIGASQIQPVVGGISIPVVMNHLRNQGDMMVYLRQNTASQEITLGQFLDSTDGNTAETGLTIANTDIGIWKAGATTIATKNSGGATHISGGIYSAVLDATDTNTLGSGIIFVHVSGALAVRLAFTVLEANVYDSMILASDVLDVNTTHVSGTAQTANDNGADINAILVDTTEIGVAGAGLTNINLPNQTMDITGNLSGSVGSVTAAVTTDAASRTASQADVSALATEAKQDIIDTNLDSVLVDTGTTIPAQLDSMSGATFVTGTDSLEAIRNRGDAAWVTGAGGSSPTVEEIRTEMDDNSTQLAAIVLDTGTTLPNQITALNDFDPTSDTVARVTLTDTTTTNTDMRGTDSALTDKTGFSLSAVGIDAILDEQIGDGTITMREAIRGTMAIVAAKSSGGGTATLTFRNDADTKNVLVETVDANGNRTATTFTP